MKLTLISLVFTFSFISIVYSETERTIEPKLEMTFSKIKNLAEKMPLPVVYYYFGNSALSCGLVLNKHSKTLLPILETETGSMFPYCVEFLDTASFELNSEKYAVYRYLQRDTRPEPGQKADDSTFHFVVKYSETSMIPIETLNAKNPPEAKKSALDVSKWAVRELTKK